MNNRQAGRRRGRGGQRQGGNPGRPDNGNRIDNRARGNAAQLLEKYKNLAADAQRQGDRVNTEYYLQFADHYFRVLSESRSRFEEQNQRRQRDDEGDEGDDEFGYEGEPVSPAQQSRQGAGRDHDEDDPRDPRRERSNGYRRDRQDDEPRETRPAPANDASDAEPVPAEAPRRRGRPRREPAVAAGTEADAGGNGLDIDRLPPSLGVEAPAGDEAPAERPRRGRPRRARSEDEAIPPAA